MTARGRRGGESVGREGSAMTREHARRPRSERTTARPPRLASTRDAARRQARLIDRFERALAIREPLLQDPATTACRIVNGAADAIDGLVIERFGDVLIVQLHEGRLQLDAAEARAICAHAARRLGARAVYRKLFSRDRSAVARNVGDAHTNPVPWLGQPVAAELPVIENGMTFLVRPYDGNSVGLFLEHRETRQRVRGLANGLAVLNAFAYTCAFSVAAALGGSLSTVSVDLSRKHLERGKRNFVANGLALDRYQFICSDIFDYFSRAGRQRRRFDLIILDPPTFARARRPKRTFSITENLEGLVAGAVALLNPDGYLLLATNHRGTSHRRLQHVVCSVAGARPLGGVTRLRLPPDFAGDRDYAKTVIVKLG